MCNGWIGAKLPLIWDHSSSRSSCHGTHPRRPRNHVNIALLIELSASFIQVMTVMSLCCDGLMLGSHRPFNLCFNDEGINDIVFMCKLIFPVLIFDVIPTTVTALFV